MFIFKRLDAGPRWYIIAADFPCRSAGEAFARNYLAERGFSILLLEYDEENNAIDIMAARGAAMEQFAIEVQS